MDYTQLPERAECHGCRARFRPVKQSLDLCPACYNHRQQKRQIAATLDFFKRIDAQRRKS